MLSNNNDCKPGLDGELMTPRQLLPTLWAGASVKLFEFGAGTAGGVVRRGIDFRRFHTPSLRFFGVILGVLEASKMHKLLL